MQQQRSGARRDRGTVGYPSRCRVPVAALALCLAASIFSDQTAHAQTGTAGNACTAPLQAMVAEWNAIGFPEPAKPNVAVLRGANGRTATAGQVHYMRVQLSSAVRACRDGRNEEALRYIGLVHEALNRTGPATGLMAKSD